MKQSLSIPALIAALLLALAPLGACKAEASDEETCSNPSPQRAEVCRLYTAAKNGRFPKEFGLEEAQELVNELAELAAFQRRAKESGLSHSAQVERWAESGKTCLRISGWTCSEVLFKPEE